MRVTETRQLFEQECEYPIDHDAIVEQFGSVQLEAPTGDSTRLESVFDRCESRTYESTDDVYATLMGNLDEAFIGRKYYDDRGGEAGAPHPDSEHVAY